jgi:Ca-activated chloride channel family protein
MNLLASLALFAVINTPTAPLHLCVSIDRSATMTGDKATLARRTVLDLAQRLRPSDDLAVVAYGDVVEVLARGSDRAFGPRLLALRPRGGSALFAGIVKCADELQRVTGGRHPGRIVLVSDGHATLGPTAPHELGLLGAYLREQKISVETVAVGLDHNQALMTELGRRGEGGALFLDRPEALARFLDRTLGLPERAATEHNGVVMDSRSRLVQSRRPAGPRPPQAHPMPVLPDLAKLRARIGSDPLAGADRE